MGKILRVLGQYWIALVTGPLSFALFIGTLFMTTPTQSTAGWVGAYLSGIVAAVSVLWKWVPLQLSQSAQLTLCRLRDKGKELLKVYESFGRRADSGVAEAVIDLCAWWKECERVVKKECPRVWSHFADLADRQDLPVDEHTRQYIQRIDQVIQVLTRP